MLNASTSPKLKEQTKADGEPKQADKSPLANRRGNPNIGQHPRANRFKPGQSGNPSGRPKKDYDLARAAQKHAEKAVNTLVEIMGDVQAAPPARVAAANSLLDRGFGKAAQFLAVDAKVEFGQAFEQFVRELHKMPALTLPVIDVDAEDAETAE